MLTLLEDVACKERDSARIVRLGHECMDVVSNDLLAAMPRAHLQRALHVEEAYVKQSVDVNTCYSASLNLWRMADTVGATLRVLRAQTQVRYLPSTCLVDPFVRLVPNSPASYFCMYQ